MNHKNTSHVQKNSASSEGREERIFFKGEFLGEEMIVCQSGIYKLSTLAWENMGDDLTYA